MGEMGLGAENGPRNGDIGLDLRGLGASFAAPRACQALLFERCRGRRGGERPAGWSPGAGR